MSLGFIEPESTEDVQTRCLCPPNEDGTPRHESDTVAVRDQYGYGDLLDIQKASLRFIPGVDKDGNATMRTVSDPVEEHLALLNIGIKRWTYELANGNPRPVAPITVRTLPEDVGDVIAKRINALYEASKPPVPNVSGAPSPASSPESSSARPNRATRRSQKRSTTKSGSGLASST
jgi:hypothetical protein